MFKSSIKLIETLRYEDWAEKINADDELRANLSSWLSDRLLPEFITLLSEEIDDIIEIDPYLTEREILGMVAMHMVDSLDALFASVRIYDPDTKHMLSYGSYPSDEKSREIHIPLDKSIAGKVVKSRKAFLVPNILTEELYRDKSIVERRGAYSLLAVPLEIQRFFPHERDTVGVIQIYYPEKDRGFSPMEVRLAELMSRRLSYVIARKKILSLHRISEKKEAFVRQIFLKLGAGAGVKMKDVFNRVIPELADIINLQSCALFSVTDDLEHVILEAGYPDSDSHHGIGKSFMIRDEPAFELVLGLRDYEGDSVYEVVASTHILVKNLEKSQIISESVRQFALNRNVTSILYVPLNVGDEITHFMTFDALDQDKGYSPDEIEIFLFLGRELMKAQRMERLDDILHDFKNPAIATAGFARRLNQLLEKEGLIKKDSKIRKYVDILLEETSRLQEMAMSMSHIGKYQVVNLTEVLKRRFEINKEAIKEQLKQNVTLEEGPYFDPLYIRCYPIHIERVMDNMLNNATNAIPLQGGVLAARTYKENNWACAEITNTGVISDDKRLRLLEGDARGRGLYISNRIIRLLEGSIDIQIGNKTTTVLLRIPLYNGEIQEENSSRTE